MAFPAGCGAAAAGLRRRLRHREQLDLRAGAGGDPVVQFAADDVGPSWALVRRRLASCSIAAGNDLRGDGARSRRDTKFRRDSDTGAGPRCSLAHEVHLRGAADGARSFRHR
jgi:hypothetical protein